MLTHYTLGFDSESQKDVISHNSINIERTFLDKGKRTLALRSLHSSFVEVVSHLRKVQSSPQIFNSELSLLQIFMFANLCL